MEPDGGRRHQGLDFSKGECKDATKQSRFRVTRQVLILANAQQPVQRRFSGWKKQDHRRKNRALVSFEIGKIVCTRFVSK